MNLAGKKFVYKEIGNVFNKMIEGNFSSLWKEMPIQVLQEA